MEKRTRTEHVPNRLPGVQHLLRGIRCGAGDVRSGGGVFLRAPVRCQFHPYSCSIRQCQDPEYGSADSAELGFGGVQSVLQPGTAEHCQEQQRSDQRHDRCAGQRRDQSALSEDLCPHCQFALRDPPGGLSGFGGIYAASVQTGRIHQYPGHHLFRL